MISLIYLASALLLGASITRSLKLKLLRFETPSLAIAIGLLVWTWLSFIISLILPTDFSLPVTVMLAAAGSMWLWRESPKSEARALPGGLPARVTWALFSAISIGLIGWLMWTHFLVELPSGLYSANSTWADFGLHASLISHFAAQSRLTLDFPVAAGAHLTYPFIVDLLSGWLVRGGWSLHAAIFIPSILLITAFLQLMLGFGARLFGRIGGAVVGLTLTLLCGSAVGVFTAWNDYHTGGTSLAQFLANLPRDYTALNQPNAQFTNLIADAILPQRAFLMGFSTFATILVLFSSLRRHPRRGLALFAGGLIGLLPLTHAHTYLVVMALTFALWVGAVVNTKKPYNTWMTVGLVGLVVALPQILWQLAGNGTGSGGHLSPGWTLEAGNNPLVFLVQNFGLTGLLILGLTLAVFAYRPARAYRLWYLPFVAVFLFANIYSLQAFAYDNVKLMYYCYLMTYFFVGYGALSLIRRYPLSALPLTIAGLVIVASGTLAVTREFQHQDQFASQDDLKLAQWIKQSTLPSDVFAATDRPNQPISTIAGRNLVSGYRGWLYSYHLSYEPRLETIQSGLNGRLTRQNPYNAKYVAVAAYEPPEWTVDQSALSSTYSVVYTNPSWTVYQLPDR